MIIDRKKNINLELELPSSNMNGSPLNRKFIRSKSIGSNQISVTTSTKNKNRFTKFKIQGIFLAFQSTKRKFDSIATTSQGKC